MTPHSRATVDEGLNHLEKRVIQYQIIDPASQGLKQLRNGKKVKPRSTKRIQGPRSLDRAYIEAEKVRIATATALEADKATNREARRLAKEEKAKEVKKVPVMLKSTRGGTQGTRGRGHGNVARSRATKLLKFDTEEADLRRLETAMSFITLCGGYISTSSNSLKLILIHVIERTYGKPMATSRGRSRLHGQGGRGGHGRGGF
ncbi:hypothetical protein BGX38DRAFT_375175 [Terfezia claveryi]|nr:hypothetical protein BGX38DRAFT_375175 [Terfezia claveryi]